MNQSRQDRIRTEYRRLTAQLKLLRKACTHPNKSIYDYYPILMGCNDCGQNLGSPKDDDAVKSGDTLV